MAKLEFLIPGDPETKTGGYLYDKRIASELRQLGWQVAVHRLADSFPLPTLQDLEQTERCFCRLETGALVLIDGLAFGAMDSIALSHRERLRLVALVHHPLHEETGISCEHARVFQHSETRALSCARRIIVTSKTTAEGLAKLVFDSEKIAVVRPGTDSARRVDHSHDEKLNLICVASLTARKAHSDLLDALVKLTDLPWQLHCVGSLQRDPRTAAKVVEKIARYGLGDRVRLYGECTDNELQSLYQRSHVMVLASHHEGYGMVLAEALMRGLPVIGSNAGAIPEVIGPQAGILVDSGDPIALSRAIRQFMEDPALRRRLYAGAHERAATLPSWRDSARLFATHLTSVA